MRVAPIRSDLNSIYLDDIESRTRRNFSSEPAGQSRYIKKPTDSQLLAVLNGYAFLSVRGTVAGATVDTSVNDTLRVRTASTASYTVITVTANAALAKTQLVTELNAAFLSAGLNLVASLQTGSNFVQIDSKSTNSGPGAAVQIDSVVNGSTLSTAVGFTVGGVSVTGLSVAALKAAVYPTPTSVDVSSATLLALSTFSLLSSTKQTALVDAVANLVAPSLVETGSVLLSFSYGKLSKLRSSTFRPGPVRTGYTVGAAVAIVDDDGSTPFTLL